MWFKYGLKAQKLQKQHALSGRVGQNLLSSVITQGDALGYELLGLQPVLEPHAKL